MKGWVFLDINMLGKLPEQQNYVQVTKTSRFRFLSLDYSAFLQNLP